VAIASAAANGLVENVLYVVTKFCFHDSAGVRQRFLRFLKASETDRQILASKK